MSRPLEGLHNFLTYNHMISAVIAPGKINIHKHTMNLVYTDSNCINVIESNKLVMLS